MVHFHSSLPISHTHNNDTERERHQPAAAASFMNFELKMERLDVVTVDTFFKKLKTVKI
jgi:hypothetical protein